MNLPPLIFKTDCHILCNKAKVEVHFAKPNASSVHCQKPFCVVNSRFFFFFSHRKIDKNEAQV